VKEAESFFIGSKGSDMSEGESVDPNGIQTTTAMDEVGAEIREWVSAQPLRSNTTDLMTHEEASRPERQIRQNLPQEGDDGVFSQAWFPICLDREVTTGQVLGVDFLDGRVVVWRDEEGLAHVTSAYCPHLGASLESGEVIGSTLRCGFHHWSFDSEGQCVETAIGDKPPRDACLFVFPTLERWGIIWAFNGLEPLYDLPDFPCNADRLIFKSFALPELMPVDPWVQCANTPDIQHIKTLHRISFEGKDPYEKVQWTDYSMRYSFEGFFDTGASASWDVGIFGTSLYYQSAWLEGRWFGFMVPMGLPSAGSTRNYFIVAAERSGDALRDEEFINQCTLTEMGIVGEDTHIMESLRFRPGTLTRSDRVIGKFFDYLRAYPRAHPSAPWIR